MLVRIAGVGMDDAGTYDMFLEVDAGDGFPGFVLTGLPDAAARESRDRVRVALRRLGFRLPGGRVTVNLAPADRRKTGAGLDLPLAVGLLAATGQAPAPPDGARLLGELSLDGGVKPVAGAFACGLHLRNREGAELWCPAAGAPTAAAAAGSAVVRPLAHLREAVAALHGEPPAPATPPPRGDGGPPPDVGDLADVVGQPEAKAALECAAAGGHHMLLTGPPGSGKTMLLRRMPGLLPDLEEEEALELGAVLSRAGLLTADAGLPRRRPFRAPHHTASAVGLIGGGSPVRPGEVSLAHAGVLFLDELAEFPRAVLESLRQPLEDGVVTVSRARTHVELPARFQLTAAVNPCPCGWWTGAADGVAAGDEGPVRACRCSESARRAYLARISGPLRDRVDLHVEVGRLSQADLRAGARHRGEGTAEVRTRVLGARELAADRARTLDLPDVPNARRREPADIWLRPDAGARRRLERTASAVRLTARGLARLQRTARTWADLRGSETTGGDDVDRAAGLRPEVRRPHPAPA